MHGEDATASVYMKKISLEMTNRTACHLFSSFHGIWCLCELCLGTLHLATPDFGLSWNSENAAE
jgi:hypothetical protein